MAWTKAKMAVVTGMVVLLAAATTTVGIKKIEARDAWRTYPGEYAAMDRAPSQVRILPTKFPRIGSRDSNDRGKILGIGQPVESMVQAAYASSREDHLISDARTIMPADAPQGRYDFIASQPANSGIALQKEIERKLGLVARRETREMDVLQLTIKRPNAPGLKPSAARGGRGYNGGDGDYNFNQASMDEVAYFLEGQGWRLPWLTTPASPAGSISISNGTCPIRSTII